MYHLFGYDGYYPDGGMNDYLGGFDKIEDAKIFAVETFKEPKEFYEIAQLTESDLINPAKLEIVLKGFREYKAGGGFNIEWIEWNDNHRRSA